MRHTARAAVLAALLFCGLLSPSVRAQVGTPVETYAPNPDGTWAVTLTFPDGAVLTWTATKKATTPPPTNPGAPTGLKGTYAAGKVTLTWSPVAGAKYNVYATDAPNQSNWPKLTPAPLPVTTFAETVAPAAAARTRYYTVTSVGGSGAESAGAPRVAVQIPAAAVPQPPAAATNFKIAALCPCADPATPPGHVCDCPSTARPHLHLSWTPAAASSGAIDSYQLQRGGVTIATIPAAAATYVDASDGLNWDTSYTYRLRAARGTQTSAWVGATGKTATKPATIPPDPGEGGPGGGTDPPDPPDPPTEPIPGGVTILEVRPNVSSVVFRVQPVNGAKDYWVYDPADPTKRKASGGNTVIEYNGKGANLVVEALSALAPYQPHTHVGMPPNLTNGIAITNGQGAQGAPLPPVLARSATVPITYKAPPVPAPGGIWDGFDGAGSAISKSTDGRTFLTARTADGLWSFRSEKSNYRDTDVFVSAFHPMLDQFDGMTPGAGPLSVENSNTSMLLNRTFDFSGGKVLHVRVEWDAHFDKQNRRWFKLLLWPGGEQLLTAVNIDEDFLGHEAIKHTTSGRLLLARIDGQAHTASVVKWNGSAKDVQELTSWAWDRGGKDRGGPLDRGRVYKDGKTLNGTTADIDLRHTFDWYISADRMVGYETDALGVRVKQYDVAIPGGLGYSSASIGFAGYLYHTALGLDELKAQSPEEHYWINAQKFNHVHHLDGVLAEVVPGFPAN